MAISINWTTRVITIPQTFLTYISGSLYELDVNELRLALKNIEDDENEGMVFPDTHRHNTQVSLGGVTYARTLEIINGYTVTFEDGQYVVRCVGVNHNLADVKNLNQVSLIIGNAAGLIVREVGISGLTQEESQQLALIENVKIETDKIPDVVSNTGFIRNVEGGKWSYINDQLIFYAEDNITEIARFDIEKDSKGNPITRVRI